MGESENERCPQESNSASNALRFLTLRKPSSLSYWGLWNPTWAENIFISFSLLRFYWFAGGLNRYISFDITQPTSIKIYNWRCCMCVQNPPLSRLTERSKRFICSGLTWIAAVESWLFLVFSRSTELTSVKQWKHWMGRMNRWYPVFLQSLQLKRTFLFFSGNSWHGWWVCGGSEKVALAIGEYRMTRIITKYWYNYHI